MAADDATVFRTIALGFAPEVSRAWEEATAPDAWTQFIDGLRGLAGSSRPLGAQRPYLRQRPRTSLGESMAVPEMRALFAPPDGEELRRFARRHFIGGLAASALPVESLYVPWAPRDQRALTHATGHYQSTRSLYMRDLLAALGLTLPEALGTYPDHLTVQLEVLAFLIEEGALAEAQQFLQERFAWLSDYRGRLIALGEEGRFHLALVDAVLAIRAQREAAAT